MREKRDSKAQNRRFVLSSVARSATSSYWVRLPECEVAALRTGYDVPYSCTTSTNPLSLAVNRGSGASPSWQVTLD